MGQSACKIAEAKSEAQEKPPENSLQSETAIDEHRWVNRGEALRVSEPAQGYAHADDGSEDCMEARHKSHLLAVLSPIMHL